MSWQRFNEGNHHFEKSDDNGATWVTLAIGADSILGLPSLANVAYTNVANNFVSGQQVVGSGISEWDMSTDGLQFRILNYQSRWGVYYNPAGWLFYVDTAGSMAVGFLTTPGLQVNGNAAITSNLNVGNAIFAGTDLQTGAAVISQTGVYPGRVDIGGGAKQTSWYLGSHGSYGLWTNTGLFTTGMVWAQGGLRVGLDPPGGGGAYFWFLESSNHVRAAGGLYDFSRGTPVGDWIAYSPNIWASGGGVNIYTNYGSNYMLVGHTLTMSFYMQIGSPGGYIYLSLPGGMVCNLMQAVPFVHEMGGNGMAQANVGLPYVILYATINGDLFPAANFGISGVLQLQVQ